MRLDTSIRLEQSMKLAPRMIQAMEILQLPLLALQERIDAELQCNPVLELSGPAQEPVAEEAAAAGEPADRGERDMVVNERGDNGEDFQRLSDFQEEYEPWISEGTRASAEERGDRKLDAMANTPAPQQSLQEYLLQQWTFADVPKELGAAGKLIIEHIDDDGYFRLTFEELAARWQGDGPAPGSEQLAKALALVQRLEPPGVGARDLKECLILQLSAEAAAGNDVRLEVELVQHFLRDIEMNRLPQIARRTGRSIEEIKAAITNLSRLSPHPGLLVGDRTVPVIVPDVIVDLDESGEVRVSLPQGSGPHLVISRSYRRMAKDRSVQRDARQFIRRNIVNAQWLLAAIEQRRQTIGHVAEEVFKVQREFLSAGPEALKPLPMADVAAKVGVHVATVSRAVAGKYAQTPMGIFPLRMFFSGGKTTAAGEDVAWDAIRVKLKEVVDAEDKANPLNDDEIVEAMQARGITIARRTVAKYRSLMEIPPARKRRKF